jgi:hypothetical protein
MCSNCEFEMLALLIGESCYGFRNHLIGYLNNFINKLLLLKVCYFYLLRLKKNHGESNKNQGNRYNSNFLNASKVLKPTLIDRLHFNQWHQQCYT